MSIKNIRFREQPVSIREWLTSDYYLGPEAKALRPYWRDKIIEYFENDYHDFVFSGSSRSGKCVPPHTRISTENGYLPIKSLFMNTSWGCVPTSDLKVHTPTGLKEVSHLYSESKTEILILEDKWGNRVEGTPEHKVNSYVPGKGQSLRTLQELVSLHDSGQSVFLSFSLQPLEYPSQPYSEEVFYSLGKWIGDGYVAFYKKSSKLNFYFLSASQSSVEHFKKHLQIVGDVLPVKDTRQRKQMYRIRINPDSLFFNFIDRNKHCNAYNKRVPDIVFCSSVRQRAAFLQGLLDTDGWLENGRYHICLSNKNLIQDISDLFQSLGFVTSVRPRTTTYTGADKRFPCWVLHVLSLKPNQYDIFNFDFAVKKLINPKYHSFQTRDPVFISEYDIDRAIALTTKETCPYPKWMRVRFRRKIRGSAPLRELLYRYSEKFNIPFLRYEADSIFQSKLVSYRRDVSDVYDITVPDGHVFYAQGLVNHNTFSSSILTLRYIYDIYCVEDFPTLFDLSPTTLPKIVFFSFSKDKASSVGIERLIRMVDRIPWFNTNGRKRRPVQTTLSYPWVEVVSGSNISHAIGEDAFMGILDEANIRNVAKAREVTEAQSLLMEIAMRSATTYSYGGKWYGATGVISTAENSSSFVDSLISESRQKNKHRLIVEASVYEVSPQNFSPDKFQVFIGDADVSAFIVDSPSPTTAQEVLTASGLTIEQYISQYDSLVISVPNDLRPFYEDDIEKALSNLSGLTRSSTSHFFKRTNVVEQMFNSTTAPIFNDYCPHIGIYDNFDVDSWLDEGIIFSRYSNQNVYCHLDISRKHDFTGISFLYYDSDSKKICDLLTVCAHRTTTIPDNEIDQTKVLAIILWLYNHGARLAYVSADQYASAYVLQQCKLLLGKDKAGHLSVDVDPAAYLAVLNYAKKGVYNLAPNPKLKIELQGLTYDRYSGKVDHGYNSDPSFPSKYPHDTYGIVQGFHSKDIADALAGASFHLLTKEMVSYDDLILTESAKMSAQEHQELFGEDFYSDLPNYEDPEEQSTSFEDELISSLL